MVTTLEMLESLHELTSGADRDSDKLIEMAEGEGFLSEEDRINLRLAATLLQTLKVCLSSTTENYLKLAELHDDMINRLMALNK